MEYDNFINTMTANWIKKLHTRAPIDHDLARSSILAISILTDFILKLNWQLTDTILKLKLNSDLKLTVFALLFKPFVLSPFPCPGMDPYLNFHSFLSQQSGPYSSNSGMCIDKKQRCLSITKDIVLSSKKLPRRLGDREKTGKNNKNRAYTRCGIHHRESVNAWNRYRIFWRPYTLRGNCFSGERNATNPWERVFALSERIPLFSRSWNALETIMKRF